MLSVRIQSHYLDHEAGSAPLPSRARNPGCNMLFKDEEDWTGCQDICIWASLLPLFEKARIFGIPISFHFNVECGLTPLTELHFEKKKTKNKELSLRVGVSKAVTLQRCLMR